MSEGKRKGHLLEKIGPERSSAVGVQRAGKGHLSSLFRSLWQQALHRLALAWEKKSVLTFQSPDVLGSMRAFTVSRTVQK